MKLKLVGLRKSDVLVRVIKFELCILFYSSEVLHGGTSSINLITNIIKTVLELSKINCKLEFLNGLDRLEMRIY